MEPWKYQPEEIEPLKKMKARIYVHLTTKGVNSVEDKVTNTWVI
jgi:hypothetical protein